MTLELVTPVRLPQAGAHAVPLAVRFQLTPLFVESFCTVALKTNALAPVFTELTLFVMVTVSAAVIMNVSESDLFVLATEVAVNVG